jgi:hypothetical protein
MRKNPSTRFEKRNRLFFSLLIFYFIYLAEQPVLASEAA